MNNSKFVLRHQKIAVHPSIKCSWILVFDLFQRWNKSNTKIQEYTLVC